MNKIFHTTLLIVLVCLYPVLVSAQSWQWEKGAGGMDTAYARGIDADNDGNSFITGEFNDSVSLGGITLITPNVHSVYIAKYNINGNCMWARVAASGTNIQARSICIDKQGNICITGQYSGTGYFGDSNPISLTSDGDYDVYVARYNSTGDVKWAKTAGGPGVDFGNGISTDANCNVFITGEFHISPFYLSASKIFVAKYDSTGNSIWVTQPPDYSNFHKSNGIKTDSFGNSYITGQFFNWLTFDSLTILDAANVEANVFIAKIDDSGKTIWLQKAGAATGYAAGNAIDIDNHGNVYVTGFYRGLIAFGGLSLSGPTTISYDVFIAKCNTNGDFVWVSKASGPGALDEGIGISTDNAGHCYLTGHYSGSLNVGATVLTGQGQTDIFVAEADTSGNFIWASQCGGPMDDNAAGIKATAQGIFVAGSFMNTMQFLNSGALSSGNNNPHMFLARIHTAASFTPQEKMVHDINIFPNPAADKLFMNGASGGDEYTIYDDIGRMICHGRISSMKTIDIKELEKGSYIIRIISKYQQTANTLVFVKY